MTTEVFEQLMKDVSDRMAALDGLKEMVSEERIKQLVQTSLDAMFNDKEFVRKMRFGSQSDAKVQGTKYARFGLSLADIEFLYDLQLSLQGQRKVGGVGLYEGPSEELSNTFKAISDAYYLTQDEIRAIDQRAIDDMFPRLSKRNIHAYEAAMRAMDTAETGYGLQLIGAQYVGELWEGARKESRIFSLLDTFEMNAPVAYLPVEADLPEMLFVTENTSATASDYTTDKSGSNRVTTTAYKFIVHQMWSGEMEEDSIVPYIPFLRRQAELSLAHYSDSAVLNGDTTNAGTGNINLDDADPADTKHYLAFDGLRHVCLVDNANTTTGNLVNHSGAALTYNAILDLRKRMLDTTYLFDWGHPTVAADLIFIMDPTTAEEACQLDEVKTIDQLGPQATVLTGQQAQIAGHPLISSIAMSLTEDDGKVSTTAANNIYGGVLAFNRRGYKVGWRRRVKVETERLPGRDQTRLIHSLRMGLGRFSPTGAASGIESAALLEYVAVA